jgi:hypothetical protein
VHHRLAADYHAPSDERPHQALSLRQTTVFEQVFQFVDVLRNLTDAQLTGRRLGNST